MREVFEALDRGDWETWETLHHPEGADDSRRLFEELLERDDDWRAEVESIESVGEGRVLMFGRSVFQVFELEDGRVRRVQAFGSSDEAREAADAGLTR